MNLKIKNTELFKNIISSVKSLANEVEFYLSPDEGLTISAMDASHICAIDLHLLHGAFDEFSIDQDRVIGVSLPNLEKILNMAKKGDSVQISLEDNKDKMNVLVTGDKKKVNFNLSLFDIDGEQHAIPELDYTHIIRMESSEFNTAMKDVMSIGADRCIVKTAGVEEKIIEFDVKGDIGEGILSIEECEVTDSEGNNPDEDIRMNANVNYLSTFAKSSKLSNEIVIKLGENLPLCCDYDLGEDVGYLRFYLAPKEDDDEEE